ncbi:MAG: type II toxin-antitoxin system RelE/ParE family toxin [Planctomycetaceae bacterium]
MRVVVHEEAESEFVDAAQWYDARQAGLGGEFLDELHVAIDKLKDDPESHSLLETVDVAGRVYRRRALRRFPYLIIFEVVKDEVQVVAVAHMHRQEDYWIDRSF